MILLYQMAKVASHSWLALAQAATPPGGPPPLHVHYISGDSRRRFARVLAAPAHLQTIANLILPRDQLRKSTAARAAIEEARQRGEPIRVLCGMREPVARSLSLFMFMADFYGHRTVPTGQGAAICARLAEAWEGVFVDAEPCGTFEWVLRHGLGAYRTWFAHEIAATLGLDPLAQRFPPGGGAQVLRGDGVAALFYRVEDLAPDAPGNAALRDTAAAFLGVPIDAFPRANAAADRRSRALYQAAAGALSLRPELLDAIYDAPTVRHFYAPAELESFKRRWRGPAGAAPSLVA